VTRVFASVASRNDEAREECGASGLHILVEEGPALASKAQQTEETTPLGLWRIIRGVRADHCETIPRLMPLIRQ
jgi:hypothetical protein